MQLLAGAELTGLEFAKRMGADSIAELRKVPPEKWANDPASQMGNLWPVIDGYVIIDDQYKLYEAGKYNDVPVLLGTNSDEGSMFVRAMQPEQYEKTIRERFGAYSEKILKAYPAKTEAETQRALADIFRDVVFAWPSWAWARLQTKTGNSDVFLYYFNQIPPASILSSMFQSNGASHGSEIMYVFKNLDMNQLTKYTDQDKALSETMAAYWTNFAKAGNPNGSGLPEWPVFQPGEPTVMYFKGEPKTGPVPNLDKLSLMEEYFAWKREAEDSK